MNRKDHWYFPIRTLFLVVLLSGLSILLLTTFLTNITVRVLAQDEISEPRPLDMMLVIDNSGSMFPEDQIPSCATTWGSDPDFLRIVGANLFIARLGFDEQNTDQYQLGIVSMGENARLIAPLQPLQAARDTLSRDIANPAPECQTQIIPALERAYQELRTSPNRRPSNTPAIVLITDGVPYPPDRQSNADIERLLKENPDIPLFIMLLQDPDSHVAGYEDYISFWQQMEFEYDHVLSYKIESDEQIEETYNSIAAQLQNTIPSRGFSISSGSPKEIYVGKYVRRIVVSVIHKSGIPKGNVTITDPNGVLVQMNESGVGREGVSHFRGSINPVEVISISHPRLDDTLKKPLNENPWIIESDTDVIVFLDRQGAYNINILEPTISLTDISNVYLATERQSPDQPLRIRFNLLDGKGNIIPEKQPLQGEVTAPDETKTSMRIPTSITPDSNGIYELSYSAPDTGRFAFVLKAGMADGTATEYIPVAQVRLIVDFGRGPYLDDITPDPIICSAGQPVTTTVSVGGYNTVIPDTVGVRIFGNGNDVLLAPDKPGTFKGDIAPLCDQFLSPLSCGATHDATFKVRISGSLQEDGTPFSPIERDMPVEIRAPACPSPTPTPTPIPDTDADTFHDLEDDCPETWGLSWFQGCLPLWFVAAIILAFIVAASVIIFYIVPCTLVRINKPPSGYIQIMRTTASRTTAPVVHSVFDKGMSGCTSRVTIGSRRFLFWKDTIYVSGLKPGQFVIKEEGGQVVLFDTSTNQKHPFGKTAKSIDSGNVKLRICQERENLR
jgi:hypothetical protein